MTITRTPDLEQRLEKESRRRGTTPELLALALLQERSADSNELADLTPPAVSLAELLADHIGVLDSRELVPGGAQLSQDTGKQFAAILLQKKRQESL